jgi:beta-lactamase superfamily II metal-dependent hydrolase
MPGKANTGESILIKTPERKTILVDSGTEEGGSAVARYLAKAGIERIGYAIATHMHNDHVGRFPLIMDTVETGKLFTSSFTNYSASCPQALALAKAVSKHNIPVKSDFIKVPHHSSMFSSSMLFLNTVKPKKCVLRLFF